MKRQTKALLGVVVAAVILMVGVPLAYSFASTAPTFTPTGFVIPSTPNPCASSPASAATVSGLQIEADATPAAGQLACLHGLFTNTGTASIDLSDYSFNLNVAGANGTTVYSTSCVTLNPNPILPPGGTWDCRAYWTAGPAGLYHLEVSIHSFSQNQDIVSAGATITTH